MTQGERLVKTLLKVARMVVQGMVPAPRLPRPDALE
jgi:hypothetical protein